MRKTFCALLSLLILLSAVFTLALSDEAPADPNAEFKQGYRLCAVEISDGLIMIEKDRLYGYADLNGNVVLEPKWERTSPFICGQAIVSENRRGDFYVIDRSGNNIFQRSWDRIDDLGDYYLVSERDALTSERKSGLMDRNGNIIVEVKYESARPIGSIFAVKTDGMWGAINSDGETVIPFEYVSLNSLNDHLYYAGTGDSVISYRLFNSQGEIVSETLYDDIKTFYENRAVVMKGDCYGYIDEDGNAVTGLEFEDAKGFNDGIAWVRKNEKWGCIDLDGNEVIPFAYDHQSYFMNGTARVIFNGKYGTIDLDNRTVIPFEYDILTESSDGLRVAAKDGKTGVVDEDGNTVVDFVWRGIGSIGEGLAFSSDNKGNRYCIETSGNIVFECPYKQAVYEKFHNGIAIFSLVDENDYLRGTGLISSRGEVLVEPEYAAVSSPCDHLYWLFSVSDNKQTGKLIRDTGEILLEGEFRYTSPAPDENGYMLAVGNSDWYIIDSEGNIVF